MMTREEEDGSVWWTRAAVAIYALVIGCCIWALGCVPAPAQETKANMTTEINNNFPDNVTGLITPSIQRTTTTDMVNSWQQAPQTRLVNSGTSDTITAADYGHVILYVDANAVAVTLPQATGTFATFNFWAKNTGTQTVTITPNTSQINGAASLALIPNTGAWIISDGTNWQLGPHVIFSAKHQVFNASGTYTPSANLMWAVSEGCGGGGGGGGAVGAAARFVGGGGGAAGTYSRVALSPSQIGASQTVTIGAAGTAGSGAAGGTGGATSLGSLLTAPGGGGGNLNDATSNFGQGGTPGAAGTGDLSQPGSAGSNGTTATTALFFGGTGAAGFYGGAPVNNVTSGTNAFAGNAGAANSCAGGGGSVSGNTAANNAGGAGGSGKLVVLEYLGL